MAKTFKMNVSFDVSIVVHDVDTQQAIAYARKRLKGAGDPKATLDNEAKYQISLCQRLVAAADAGESVDDMLLAMIKTNYRKGIRRLVVEDGGKDVSVSPIKLTTLE